MPFRHSIEAMEDTKSAPCTTLRPESTPIDVTTDAELFDNLLDAVGSDGYFQKRFNVIFNFALISIFSMAFINYLIAMTVPEHWCRVPGREYTNLTSEQWKEIVIPRENDAHGKEMFSKCHMYNLTLPEIMELGTSNITRKKHQIIECQHGWKYDTTWYSSTVPSDYDWVCEKELYVTNAFAYARVGDILGTLIFGQLGDMIGRKPVFLISLAIAVIGRSASALTFGIYPLFATFTLMANSCSNAVFQSPLAIGMEVSSKTLHSRINAVQYVAWTMGLSLLPFIAWMIPDWRILILITTLPTGFFLFLYRFVPESPRWLASKGHTEEAAKILAVIAKVNHKVLPTDCMDILNHVSESCQKQKCYGIISLFSSSHLAIRSVTLMFCWIATPLSYDVLILNVSNLSGNPFLNFFYQSIVELPAYVVGMWLTESIGRRWTHVAFLLVNFFICSSIILLKSYYDLSWLSIMLVMLSKFCISLTFYTLYLQSLEIYPTCLRQTGSSAGVITASAFGLLGPYIVYLGTSVDSRYPYACMAFMAIIGALVASFLPETLDQQLPETLGEAHVFGRTQKYWSMAMKSRSVGRREEMEMRERLPLRKKKITL